MGGKKRPSSSSRRYIWRTYLKYNRNVNFDCLLESNDECFCFHIIHIGIFHPSIFFILPYFSSIRIFHPSIFFILPYFSSRYFQQQMRQMQRDRQRKCTVRQKGFAQANIFWYIIQHLNFSQKLSLKLYSLMCRFLFLVNRRESFSDFWARLHLTFIPPFALEQNFYQLCKFPTTV